MTQSKIDVSVGNVSFSGEGEQAWLAEQLDKVLKVAPEIGRAPPAKGSASTHEDDSQSGEQFKLSLAQYIKQKSAEKNQVDRFLVTADWLRRRGANKLTTAEVSKALVNNHQKRLANPADCLNKNVSKGYCEKADGGFYITPEGLSKLEHTE